jgi:DeoR/GlpR family transcriptional regulator of sugar metabolism
MIANADRSIVMVDHSKFDKISLYRTCGLDDVDVVLYNCNLDPSYAKAAPNTKFRSVDSVH